MFTKKGNRRMEAILLKMHKRIVDGMGVIDSAKKAIKEFHTLCWKRTPKGMGECSDTAVRESVLCTIDRVASAHGVDRWELSELDDWRQTL